MPSIMKPLAENESASFDTLGRNVSAGLVSGNIRIHNRRTSVRLEPDMWDALNEIAAAKQTSIHALCTEVFDSKTGSGSFASALRIFLLNYYRHPPRNL